jgi:hypothetical protein
MERNRRTLADILDALEDVGARHAVLGGLLAGFHGAERATADVDVLLPRAYVKQVQTGLDRRGYIVRPFPNVTKIWVHGEPVSLGDLLPLETNQVLRAAFAATEPAVILGLPVSAVKRGAYVALKFEAAAATRRQPRDRARDVADIRAVLAKTFDPQDEHLAAEIAAKMYPGAVADLESLIEDVRCERPPRVAIRAAKRSALLTRQGTANFGRGSALAWCG